MGTKIMIYLSLQASALVFSGYTIKLSLKTTVASLSKSAFISIAIASIGKSTKRGLKRIRPC